MLAGGLGAGRPRHSWPWHLQVGEAVVDLARIAACNILNGSRTPKRNPEPQMWCSFPATPTPSPPVPVCNSHKGLHRGSVTVITPRQTLTPYCGIAMHCPSVSADRTHRVAAGSVSDIATFTAPAGHTTQTYTRTELTFTGQSVTGTIVQFFPPRTQTDM